MNILDKSQLRSVYESFSTPLSLLITKDSFVNCLFKNKFCLFKGVNFINNNSNDLLNPENMQQTSIDSLNELFQYLIEEKKKMSKLVILDQTSVEYKEEEEKAFKSQNYLESTNTTILHSTNDIDKYSITYVEFKFLLTRVLFNSNIIFNSIVYFIYCMKSDEIRRNQTSDDILIDNLEDPDIPDQNEISSEKIINEECNDNGNLESPSNYIHENLSQKLKNETKIKDQIGNNILANPQSGNTENQKNLKKSKSIQEKIVPLNPFEIKEDDEGELKKKQKDLAQFSKLNDKLNIDNNQTIPSSCKKNIESDNKNKNSSFSTINFPFIGSNELNPTNIENNNELVIIKESKKESKMFPSNGKIILDKLHNLEDLENSVHLDSFEIARNSRIEEINMKCYEKNENATRNNFKIPGSESQNNNNIKYSRGSSKLKEDKKKTKKSSQRINSQFDKDNAKYEISNEEKETKELNDTLNFIIEENVRDSIPPLRNIINTEKIIFSKPPFTLMNSSIIEGKHNIPSNLFNKILNSKKSYK